MNLCWHAVLMCSEYSSLLKKLAMFCVSYPRDLIQIPYLFWCDHHRLIFQIQFTVLYLFSCVYNHFAFIFSWNSKENKSQLSWNRQSEDNDFYYGMTFSFYHSLLQLCVWINLLLLNQLCRDACLCNNDIH